MPLLAENQDDVFDFVITKMLEEDKTFRDPIHYDIYVNHIETAIIDTTSFQRLRKIRQLGTTHLVYPGAEHSRFQHSLGVLYMTTLLIEKIKKNRFSQYTIFSTERQNEKVKSRHDRGFILMTRLTGLLHDLIVIPFSHTLEKEGNLFPTQWDDEEMIKSLIGPSSQIYQNIMTLTERLIREQFKKIDDKQRRHYAEYLTNTILSYVLRVEKFSDNYAEQKILTMCNNLYGADLWTDIMDEKFIPTSSHIVIDTICADLLDYIKRDFYYCGIKKSYDDRFLNYVCVVDYNKYPEFVYRLINKRGEIKSSVLSSMLDTLELRFDLAELVHTHDTKNCFSALIIESFNFFWQNHDGLEQKKIMNEIYMLGDDELLKYLHDHGDRVTKNLIDRYNSRTKYNGTVLLRGWQNHGQNNKPVIDKLRMAKERLALEKRIANWIGNDKLQEGDVLIYVMPPPTKLYKTLEAHAAYHIDQNTKQIKVEKLEKIAKQIQDYEISPEETNTGTIIKNRIDVLKTNFANIWKTYVFIAEDKLYLKKDILGIIEQIFKQIGIQINTNTQGQITSTILAKIEKLNVEARAFSEISELPTHLPE